MRRVYERFVAEPPLQFGRKRHTAVSDCAKLGIKRRSRV